MSGGNIRGNVLDPYIISFCVSIEFRRRRLILTMSAVVNAEKEEEEEEKEEELE